MRAREVRGEGLNIEKTNELLITLTWLNTHNEIIVVYNHSYLKYARNLFDFIVCVQIFVSAYN